jgi:branched-chain amino acid transport system substrate-binding protein
MQKIIENCGSNLTRENIMKQAASLKDLKLPLLLPGISISTGPNDFYPVEQAQLARFTGTQWKLFGDVIAATTD